MFVNKKKMSLAQKIFYICSFLFLIGAFVYLGSKDYKPKTKLSDAQRFTQEYGITEENIYKEMNAQEILEILNSGSGIIFIGYPENKWSATIADILNESAKKKEIKEIFYYNPEQNRKENNFYYEHIVELLTPYLKVLDNEVIDLYVPTVVFVKNGKVLFFDDETSIVTGNELVSTYWTETKRYQKGLEYLRYIESWLE